jgi:integrase
MSVYKRDGADAYSYDFQYRGRRFSGSTGKATKREAEKYEKAFREHVKAQQADPSEPMTFAVASSRYWNEIGQHHADADGTLRHSAWLVKHIGAHMLVADIDGSLVARLVAKRRGEGVKPATVNRSVTEMLRKILRRADRTWKASVQKIEWGDHLLTEPQERVREASLKEEADAIAAMPEDYRSALRFAILTGCRRIEIVGLTWQRVDFFNREFRVIGKRDLARTIPMTDEVHDLLWSLKDNHAEAVFTYVAKRKRDGRGLGERHPITYSGFTMAWRRHGKKAVTDFRFHDTRHTAATRLVRATGNIKLAQKLLGHTSVKTTTRYAHVTHDDLRNGLEAASRAKSPTQNPTHDAVNSAKVK